VQTLVCSMCHETKPLNAYHRHSRTKRGFNYLCIVCARARRLEVKAAFQANPDPVVVEKRRATDRARYRANPGTYSRRRDTWRGVNRHTKRYKEQITAQNRRAHAKNRDVINARTRVKRAANREAFNANHRAWRKQRRLTHPDSFRTSESKRRARQRGAAIRDFTAQQWRAMQELVDHRCTYCGKRCKGKLTQDHIVPLSKGGNHTWTNITPACSSCNSKKYTGPPPQPVQLLLAV
jgi:5-methylcytosine-specific restriction endonuclease McrA